MCINTNGNGATWNTVLNACVCRMTFVYDTEKGCVCPANQNLGPMGSCVCQFGFYYKGDVCVKCGDNSYSSPDYRTCFCRDGFVKQGDNCVESQTCGNNQVYSVDLKKCVCNIPGMVIDNNNQCVCPDNQ